MALITSPVSFSVSGSVSPTTWWLRCPKYPAYDMAVRAEGWQSAKRRPSRTFEPEGRTRAVVLRGPVLGYSGTCTFRTHNEAEFLALTAILDLNETLLLQNTLGRQWFVEVTGDYTEQQIIAAAATDPFPTRHLHRLSVPFTEVEEPA